MTKILEITHSGEQLSQSLVWLESEKVSKLYNGFDTSNLQTHAPDVHLVVSNEQGDAIARCSLWWENVPKMDDETMVAIGHYAVIDCEDGSRCVKSLLDCATELAKRNKGTCLVGPMDGNTWRSYRLVTGFYDNSIPPFFLEPQNPECYPQQFETVGFKSLAEYISAININLAHIDPRIDKAMERFADRGIRIRTLKADNFEAELKKIFQLSVVSFVNNYLYTPISEQEFVSQYQKVQALVVPELVLLAVDDQDNLLGYAFALPDIAQKMRGETIDTIIIKTVAVKPVRQAKGLGSILTAEVHKRAHLAGYKRAIHALMHQSNTSTNISGHYAKPFRRYTLYRMKIYS